MRNVALTFGNVVAALGNVAATLGNVGATLGNVVVTLGNIAATLGNVAATLDNVAITLGNIVATLGKVAVTLGKIAITWAFFAALKLVDRSLLAGLKFIRRISRLPANAPQVQEDQSYIFYYPYAAARRAGPSCHDGLVIVR